MMEAPAKLSCDKSKEEDGDLYDYLYSNLDVNSPPPNAAAAAVPSSVDVSKAAADEEKIRVLGELNRQLEEKMIKMKDNFSALLKTARTEIVRKDGMIADLKRQLDDVMFRRACKLGAKKEFLEVWGNVHGQQVPENEDFKRRLDAFLKGSPAPSEKLTRKRERDKVDSRPEKKEAKKRRLSTAAITEETKERVSEVGKHELHGGKHRPARAETAIVDNTVTSTRRELKAAAIKEGDKDVAQMVCPRSAARDPDANKTSRNAIVAKQVKQKEERKAASSKPSSLTLQGIPSPTTKAAVKDNVLMENSRCTSKDAPGINATQKIGLRSQEDSLNEKKEAFKSAVKAEQAKQKEMGNAASSKQQQQVPSKNASIKEATPKNCPNSVASSSDGKKSFAIVVTANQNGKTALSKQQQPVPTKAAKIVTPAKVVSKENNSMKNREASNKSTPAKAALNSTEKHGSSTTTEQTVTKSRSTPEKGKKTTGLFLQAESKMSNSAVVERKSSRTDKVIAGPASTVMKSEKAVPSSSSNRVPSKTSDKTEQLRGSCSSVPPPLPAAASPTRERVRRDSRAKDEKLSRTKKVEEESRSRDKRESDSRSSRHSSRTSATAGKDRSRSPRGGGRREDSQTRRSESRAESSKTREDSNSRTKDKEKSRHHRSGDKNRDTEGSRRTRGDSERNSRDAAAEKCSQPSTVSKTLDNAHLKDTSSGPSSAAPPLTPKNDKAAALSDDIEDGELCDSDEEESKINQEAKIDGKGSANKQEDWNNVKKSDSTAKVELNKAKETAGKEKRKSEAKPAKGKSDLQGSTNGRLSMQIPANSNKVEEHAALLQDDVRTKEVRLPSDVALKERCLEKCEKATTTTSIIAPDDIDDMDTNDLTHLLKAKEQLMEKLQKEENYLKTLKASPTGEKAAATTPPAVTGSSSRSLPRRTSPRKLATKEPLTLKLKVPKAENAANDPSAAISSLESKAQLEEQPCTPQKTLVNFNSIAGIASILRGSLVPGGYISPGTGMIRTPTPTSANPFKNFSQPYGSTPRRSPRKAATVTSSEDEMDICKNKSPAQSALLAKTRSKQKELFKDIDESANLCAAAAVVPAVAVAQLPFREMGDNSVSTLTGLGLDLTDSSQGSDVAATSTAASPPATGTAEKKKKDKKKHKKPHKEKSEKVGDRKKKKSKKEKENKKKPKVKFGPSSSQSQHHFSFVYQE